MSDRLLLRISFAPAGHSENWLPCVIIRVIAFSLQCVRSISSTTVLYYCCTVSIRAIGSSRVVRYYKPQCMVVLLGATVLDERRGPVRTEADYQTIQPVILLAADLQSAQ